ncbi:MAG: methyl-accepting chemotaxis protein [Selenomonadaceae bacterium]|nr:methyl-accepting chemotaxis protein [Selenomonadaceae bacterium]
MNFSLMKKFFIVAVMAGTLISLVSIVGYYMSNKGLNESIEAEMNAVIDAQANELNGWLDKKAASAEFAANLFTGYNGDLTRMKTRELLGLATSDKDILEMTVGLSDGYFFSYNSGDSTGKVDPTARPWYKAAVAAGGTIFTEAYVDVNTQKLIFSAAAPIKANGRIIGAVCNDITLNVLTDQVKKMTYRGQGNGIIMERSGNILARSRSSDTKSVQEIPYLASHFDEMLNQPIGHFVIAGDGTQGDEIFVYATLNTTGWILGIAVAEDFVFATARQLRNVYLVLAIIGLVLMLVILRKMATSITTPIIELEGHASELAKGNLKMKDIAITTEDEVGSLARAFNEMSKNLRNLISKMANTSDQVAAASEQLTASAHQSADTSVHVAESVGDVSNNMNQQLEDITAAKESVDIVFGDIEQMSEKTKDVTRASNETAQAAQRGEELMKSAVGKMGNIEKSVMASAEVVRKLGENSQQIGQIVEAISAIAEQTNLLALNAAIEAARAGEQGRGFAVVAEEVRKLAAESQTSAEQIRDRITQIQNETANAVESMESGTRDVKEGTAAIREVGEQFQQIMRRVDDIKKQMGGIGTSMKTVSDGASKIVTAVESIDEVSRKTSEHTTTISAATQEQSASNEEIAAASQALSNLATEMQEAVGRFKI